MKRPSQRKLKRRNARGVVAISTRRKSSRKSYDLCESDQQIEELVNGGVSLDEIGVISPYSAQVSQLTSQMKRLTNSYSQ